MAGLYIHIPFCGSKCAYCDFYSMPQHSDQIDAYIDALLVEAKSRRDELGGEQLLTLYVGGGTPSLLSSDQFKRLCDGLRRVFDLSNITEFTVEVNPDDVSRQLIDDFVACGVNRVSMGIQSFNDDELRLIGRRHTVQQAIDAVMAIRNAGLGNISIDLIFGLPGQSLAIWQHNVEQAVALGVQHISAYSLMWEQGTRLWAMRQRGKVHEVSEDDSLAMEAFLAQRLKIAGFEHYEISNFGLPGYHSLHNSNYWNLTPYLGLGAAAHSYDGQRRSYNPANLKAYLANPCGAVAETMEEWERYDEYVMLRLRTSHGLELNKLQELMGSRFASYFVQQAQPLLATGHLSCDSGRYYVPERWVMLTDAVTRDLMWDYS